MNNAPALVKEVKFFPLPAEVYQLNLDHLEKRKIGTVFGGESKIDLRIEELLKLEKQM